MITDTDVICDKCENPLVLITNDEDTVNADSDMYIVWTEHEHDWWVCINCKSYYTVHQPCQNLVDPDWDDFDYMEERAKKVKEYLEKKPQFSTYIGQDVNYINWEKNIQIVRGYMNKDGTESKEINEFNECDQDFDEIHEFDEINENDLKKFRYYVGDKSLHYMDTCMPTGPDGGYNFYFKCDNCDKIYAFTDK